MGRYVVAGIYYCLMQNKVTFTKADILQTIEFTAWDLVQVKSDLDIISAIRKLRKSKPIKQNYSHLLWRLERSLETSCVVTLSKLFDDKGECLTKLFNQVENFKVNDEEIDVKRYKEFVKNIPGLKKVVRIIEAQLNPLRNVFRAHNFPYRFKNSMGPEFSLMHMKKWTRVGDYIYAEIRKLLKVRFRMRHLYDRESGSELRKFIQAVLLKGEVGDSSYPREDRESK